MRRHALIKKARVIVAPADFASPIFEREFVCNGDEKGEIAVSALGFFILYVNGRRVANEYFLPSCSLYERRDCGSFTYPIYDEFTYRCYYSVYDISEYLCPGKNRIEIAVGEGWYRQSARVAEGKVAFGDCAGVIYAVTLSSDKAEQTILSDGSEVCRESRIRYSNLFIGEVCDYSIEDDRLRYANTRVKDMPCTVFTREDSAPDIVIRSIVPRLVYRTAECCIYDVGENISGFVSLKTKGRLGECIRIRFAENLDGCKPDYTSTGADYICADGRPQIMEDIVVCDGAQREYEPLFVWHTFRYFEIVGEADDVTVKVVHSNVPVTSRFRSSVPELNWLYDAFIRTQLNSMHSGVPMDCPHRERLGYTGDGQVTAPAVMLMMDCKAFYRKWIRDIFDSQDRHSGHINHTAPFAGGGGGPGGWGCAAITVPYNYCKAFGDISPIAENYDRMKRWIEYLVDRSEGGLVVREEDGGWCLGDWATLDKTVIPEPLVNTAYMIRSCEMMCELARLLDRSEDIDFYSERARIGREAIVREYFDEADGSYAHGVQGADAVALLAGVGGDELLDNLERRYSALGHLDTGFLCTDLLFEELFRGNRTDTAYRLLASHELGSFGYMMDHGASTIWESYSGDASHCHPMFGACSRQLFTSVLGIRQKEGSFGYSDVVISPKIFNYDGFAEGAVMTPLGEISVGWQRRKNEVEILVDLPDGMSCDFSLGACRKRLKGRNTLTITL